jgi:hypothetical protein
MAEQAADRQKKAGLPDFNLPLIVGERIGEKGEGLRS